MPRLANPSPMSSASTTSPRRVPTIPPAPLPPHPQDVRRLLTKRQRRILELVGEGRSNHEISLVLCRSEDTIDAHIRNIREVLGVSSRSVLILTAVAAGLHRPVVTRPPRQTA